MYVFSCCAHWVYFFYNFYKKEQEQMDPAVMEKQEPLVTPEQDALNHIADGRDKPCLEQRFINSFKGTKFVCIFEDISVYFRTKSFF